MKKSDVFINKNMRGGEEVPTLFQTIFHQFITL